MNQTLNHLRPKRGTRICTMGPMFFRSCSACHTCASKRYQFLNYIQTIPNKTYPQHSIGMGHIILGFLEKQKEFSTQHSAFDNRARCVCSLGASGLVISPAKISVGAGEVATLTAGPSQPAGPRPQGALSSCKAILPQSLLEGKTQWPDHPRPPPHMPSRARDQPE